MKITIEDQIKRGQTEPSYDITVETLGFLLEQQGVWGASRREVIKIVKDVLKRGSRDYHTRG